MIYLDNAATTKLDDDVLEEMLPYMHETYGNPGAMYSFGNKALKAIEKAREQVAELIGAKPDQIIFTSGGSEANNLALQKSIRPHPDVCISNIEHDSIQHLCDANFCNFKHRTCECGSDGRVEASAVHRVLNDTIGLVSVMHTNNETGVVNPVKEIGNICHERNILFHTDCVQALSTHRIDVKDIDCDFLSMSAHKIHGPKGVGALYVKNLNTISPLIFGGEKQEFGLRGGTENVVGIVGFGKACEILNGRLEDDAIYCTNLINRLYAGIMTELDNSGIENHIYRNGEPETTKILNLRFEGISGETLLLVLDSMGICVSAGSACSAHESKPSKVLIAMGIDREEARSSLRFSVSKYNTMEEVDEAASAVVRGMSFLI